MTIQAPWMNLLLAMTTVTVAVVTPPVKFTSIFLRHPGPGLSYQCRTIPNWERVKDRKTPTA